MLDRGRVGTHRLGSSQLGEIQNGVRSAIAQSRVRDPLPGLGHLPSGEDELPSLPSVHDLELAQLQTREARRMLTDQLGDDERGVLDWTDAAVAVFNSRGVRRGVKVTAAELSVACGAGPRQGRSTRAARHLSDLDFAAVADTARRRRADELAEAPIEGPVPLLLAPEAVVSLVELLSREALSAKSYHDGISFLREHLGVQVFDRSLDLRDDATDPHGIAFPFDLEGSAKRPVELIVKGAPKSPTLDLRQAAVLGLPSTAHAIGGNDSQALNLFLEGGELDEAELLRRADGGLWIGALDRIETLEPRRLLFRARASRVRRIRQGRLGRAVPPLRWEDSLLRALSDVAGIGREPTVCLTGDRYLGGASAPALALGPVAGLAPLPS